MTEFLLLRIFQAGEEGIQLSSLRDQCCLARKVIEWASDILTSSFPIVKSEESGTFKYWHFPYGPKALYTPLFESSIKKSSEHNTGRISFEDKIRYSYARIAQFLIYDYSTCGSLASNYIMSAYNPLVSDSNQEENSMIKQVTAHTHILQSVYQSSGTPIMTPLGCFFSDALEYALIQHDTQKNIAMSAKAQLILAFFRMTPLYIQQDLIQIASGLPVEVYTSFPIVYGFKDLTKKKTDRKVIQRSIDYLLEAGYILEATVPIGAKVYSVYYRCDIFVLDTYASIDSNVFGFLQNTPTLLDRLKAYLSTLLNLLVHDEPESNADLEQDCINDTMSSSADLSASSEPSAPSWITSSVPKLVNYEGVSLYLHDLNRNTKQSDVQITVLAESTRNSQSMDLFSTYVSTYFETLTSIRADIAQSRRKNNLRRIMLLHLIFLQAANSEKQSSISDISFYDTLTFSEFAYLFPLPDSSPLNVLFLPYLLSFPNTPINKVSNPALYLLVLSNFFIMKINKYREWLQHIDILHWCIEQPNANIKNYVHRSISHLPSLRLGDIKKHSTVLRSVLSALYSSLYLSGIAATIRVDGTADTIYIDLLEPISISTEQEVVLFWSLLEDFSLRMHIALKLVTEREQLAMSCLCNELTVYTLIRSWVFNVETKSFLKERLGDLDFIPTIRLSMSRAREAAMSLCDTLGQHGTVVHINAFMGALQKEIQRIMETEGYNHQKFEPQYPITNLLIIDYYRLSSIAVSNLPQKYLDRHFNGLSDNALEYYRFSQQSTLNFIMYSMRVSTITFYDSSPQSESNDCNLQNCVYIPNLFVQTEDVDANANIVIQCTPDITRKIHKVQLHQALVARSSAPISYWVNKILLDTRPRGGKSSSLSINMQPTNSRGMEYCSIYLFTNSPWLLSFDTESITTEQIAEEKIFQKYDKAIQFMRSTHSSCLTPALRKQRRKQNQEKHLHEEIAFIIDEDAESEPRPVDHTHTLKVEDFIEIVAQYKASRQYIRPSENDSRHIENCMMHYVSLFRLILPWMCYYTSKSQHDNEKSNTLLSMQEPSNDCLTTLAKMYVVKNSTRRDFIAYGRIYSMAALSLLSPEIDVLINLPSAKERRMFLRKFSNEITSIVRNTYRERQLSDPSETVRVANLLYLLTNKIDQSPSKQLKAKLLIDKDALMNSMNSASLKLEFDRNGIADPDCITYIYENSFPDPWSPDILSLCNDIARHSSAYTADCYNCSHLLDTETQLCSLLQHILSCTLHHVNPIIKYNTNQGIFHTCYSTHRILLRRRVCIEKQMLHRSGDAVQNLLNFLNLPTLFNAIIHSTDILFTMGDSAKALQYKSLLDIVCSIRNDSILQQHLWAKEIRVYISRTLWEQHPYAITTDKASQCVNESTVSNTISGFSIQYLLASGYIRHQSHGASEYLALKTLQKPNLISADNRRHYLSCVDINTLTISNAFLLLPSILFGLYRQRYRITGSTIENIKVIDSYSTIDLVLDEESSLFNPIGEIIDTYFNSNDAISSMIGDAIKSSQDTGLELTCPLVNLTEDNMFIQKQDIDTLVQKYNDFELCLTLFNYPEHKNILLNSGFFVPKRLLTETVFVPLDVFLANPDCDQFVTEFCAISPTDSTACSTDYAVSNKHEAELSLRQILSCIALCPGITLERLCTVCVPLPPTTVCFLLNILIWDEVVEARRLTSLADGYSFQKIISDILEIEPTEFYRVFLSTNIEHLADSLYNRS